MTAPGNSALLASLLALFVACCGYAAGRLHQRRQTGRDRDEAYRDGYDTAARSVFSLAARAVGPRRAGRASGPAGSPGEPATLPAPVDRDLAAPVSTYAGEVGFPLPPASAAPSAPGPVAGPGADGFPLPPPPPSGTVPQPAAVGGVHYRRLRDPRAGQEPGAAQDGPPRPAEADDAATPAGPGRRRAAARAARAAHRAADADPDVEPTSVQWSSARPGSAPLVSAQPESTPFFSAQPASAPLVSAQPDSAPFVAAQQGTGQSTSAGRHTVPDELVQAATYRLPPDRVFRARVRDAGTTSEPPEDPTAPHVPKPRQS